MSSVSVQLAGPTARATTDLAADIPVEHLMPSMVTLVGDGCPAEGRWYAYRSGGLRLDSSGTLAQAAVVDGETLYVTQATTAIDPDLPEPVAPVSDRDAPSVRAARMLPQRMSMRHRVAATARAWIGTRVTPEAIDDTPRERAIAMWRWCDHRRRLAWMINRPRIRRTITIGVVTQADAGSSARTAHDVAAALGEGRADRVILVDGDPFRAGVSRLVDDRHLLTDVADGSVSLDARFGSGARPVTTIGCDLGAADQPSFDVYRRVLDHIRPSAGVVVIDCGPAGAGRLADLCEQMVLVTDGPVDRRVELRFRRRPTVLAITPAAGRIDLNQVDRSFPTALGAVVICDALGASEVASLLAMAWVQLGATG